MLKPLDQIGLEDFARTVTVDVHGVFHTTQAAWPIMKKQTGGVSVNISSMSSVDPLRGFTVYGACTRWVNLFS